jgi:Protein kinase domain
MGVVYEAEDLKLGRRVALKLIAGKSEGEPAALERFWREARTSSALNHPGICTIYEIDDSGNQPFLVMELLEGQTLDRAYGGQAMPLPRLIELGVQLADALDAAHRRGILHRDIKPSNIFVTGSGQAKMLDFGLARFQQTGEADSTDAGTRSTQMLTSPGSTLGTIAYMSPEQARGEALDARSDIFSLGVVLYEMATGKHPFGGTTSAVVFDKLLNYIPATAISLNHDLPPEFESIVSKALEKDRELRYQSAADLRADLRRLQRSSSASRVAASAVSLPASQSYKGMTRVPSGLTMTAARPPARTATGMLPRPLWLLGAGAAVVVLGGVTLGIWHHHRSSQALAQAVAAPAPPPHPLAVPAPVVAAPVQGTKPSAAIPLEPEPQQTRSARVRRVKAHADAPQPAIVKPAAPVQVAAVRPAAAPAPAPAAKTAPAPMVSYAARHMRFFGRSSNGTLRLSAASFTYSAGSDSLSLKRTQVRSIDGNTVVGTDGKRWRFEISGMSNDQVHAVLARWFSTGAAAAH